MFDLFKARGLFLLLLAWLQAQPVLGEIPYSNGILFRLQLRDEPPSYLFGTMHSDDPEIVTLPGVVEQAFAGSRMLVLETGMDPANLMLAVALMVSEAEQDLQSVLGETLYQRCLEAAEQVGIPEAVLPFYRLWALAMLFSMPPMESGRFLDLVLYEKALQSGKAVAALETAAEQLEGVAGLPVEDQVALLKDALNNRADMPMIYLKLKQAYLNRDLGALIELSRDEYQQADASQIARLEEALIHSRNRRMGHRLKDIIADGGVFTAVGALHLPGEQGVLELLRGMGFFVERLY